jgi:peptidoglycan hydrolase-like protein with peptidoglycan-binding domain
MDQYNQTQAIMNLQRYLRQLSYSDTRIPPVPVDGVFGNTTRRALSLFQNLYRLPVTGTADQATWNALFRAYQEDVEKHSLPAPVPFFPRYPLEYSAGLGDEGMLITVIQLLLRELLLTYGLDVANMAINGTFDPATEVAVKQFQRLHRLPESGRVDKVTWNRMAEGHKNEMTRFLQE